MTAGSWFFPTTLHNSQPGQALEADGTELKEMSQKSEDAQMIAQGRDRQLHLQVLSDVPWIQPILQRPFLLDMD